MTVSHHFPVELFRLTFSYPSLRARDLYTLRLVNAMFKNMATPIAFRSMCCPIAEDRLEAFMEFLDDVPDARKYLRSITLDAKHMEYADWSTSALSGFPSATLKFNWTLKSLQKLWMICASRTSISCAKLIMKETDTHHCFPQYHILLSLAVAGCPLTMKSLYIEHFVPHPAILDNDLIKGLFSPVSALSIAAGCNVGEHDPATVHFWSHSQDLFRPNSLVNLHSLTMHSALPLGHPTEAGYCKLHFPNLEFLSLMGHLVGPNPAQAQGDPVVETFILSHKETLASLELINCPILVRTENFLDALYQMADAFDAFHSSLVALKTFTIIQDDSPVWDMRATWDMELEMYSRTRDEDGNAWNPRFCYAGLSDEDQWYLEDFEDAEYEPVWQRDRDALAALMMTVKSRNQ